ncbi:RNA polymerase sigma factor [Massilioclostridium coli]|uniref:RNA polymerase sigma factor n=1 Tax=Massilioclostridium coli TaxID=1870991 RepID=UPI0022E3C232|nr:sigma-70 family RNA polymerase sigma factor [Massilioclostridium coli]
MRYFEADLKSERPVYGSNGEIKQVLPSREDSLDRLMEENARQFAAAAESVEDVVIRKLAVDKLHTALMQLTREERDFISALFFDEKTESDVAKALGISQQAVHKRKNRILKKLKNFFE